jgi:hypothetical protein
MLVPVAVKLKAIINITKKRAMRRQATMLLTLTVPSAAIFPLTLWRGVGR